jgi:hypothetical protein
MSTPSHRRTVDQVRATYDSLDRSVWVHSPARSDFSWSIIPQRIQQLVTDFGIGLLDIFWDEAVSVRTLNIWARSFLHDFDKAFYEQAASKPLLALFLYYVIVFAPFHLLWATVLCLVNFIVVICFVCVAPFSVVLGLMLWLPGLLMWLLWLVVYQYPVFGIIYPRVRSRTSQINTKVYKHLPNDDEALRIIRIVRLKAGKPDRRIECVLETHRLVNANFEALSYVWGVTIRPYKITVNGHPFYVSYSLFSALRQLRNAGCDRLLWIDAVAINQSDIPEKSSQVQLMRDIYSKASNVIVWLGKGSSFTPAAFHMARDFTQVAVQQHDRLWKKTTSDPHWRSVRMEWRRILEHDWWTRIWIIQEVASCSRVCLQRGSERLDWEQLQQLLGTVPFRREFEWKAGTIRFAEYIELLRTDSEADNLQAKTLLDLAWHFRHQSATFGSDKLYALQGLLHDTTPIRIISDYSKRPEQVFLEFTVSCIEKQNNLLPLSLVTGQQIPQVSWCRDWRFERDGSRSGRNLAMYPPSHRNYSASGESSVRFTVDIKQCLLSISGYEADRITKTFSMRNNTQINNGAFLAPYFYGYQCWKFLLSWEKDAGGPWTESSNQKQAFNRTITADCWDREHIDWHSRLSFKGVKEPKEENLYYSQCVDSVSLNRRFFITQSGRMGLGPGSIRKGDEVCILLGGSVPFILRKIKRAELDTQRVGLVTANTVEYHTLIGEAYCDGLMYREEGLEEDLANGNILLTQYHIL